MKKTNTVIHIDADKFYDMVMQGFVNFESFILNKGGADRTVEESYDGLLKARESRPFFLVKYLVVSSKLLRNIQKITVQVKTIKIT